MTQTAEGIDRDWVPMYWPAGPLETARREKAGDLTADAKEAIERWGDPAALDLLKGSAVNCLLVRWAAGSPADRAHQESLRGLVARGRKDGLSFIGCVSPEANEQDAVAAARAAGLAAVAFEKGSPKSDFPKLVIFSREEVAWDSSAPVLAIRGNVWPAMSGRNLSEAGPTGISWIDSNAWFALLAGVRSKRKTIWLQFDPPGKNEIVKEESYVVALADAEMAGARWILSLDDRLRAGLVRGDDRSARSWKVIAGAIAFFQQHKAWRELRPASVVGVVSDFGEQHDSGEYLNLLARRHLPVSAIEMRGARAAGFSGFKAILAMDEGAPAQDLRRQLTEFARQGGLVVTSSDWAAAGMKSPLVGHPRFAVYYVGKGRIAIAKERRPDPYVIAQDAHMLLSRTNDLVRLYNAPSSLSLYVASGDGKKAVLHLVNYSARPGNEVTAWLARPEKPARLWTPGAQNAETVKTAPVVNGIEIHLPAVNTYAAVELG
jgi:hypothetical protein